MTDDELKRLFQELGQDNLALRQENAAAHEANRGHFDAAVDRLSAENRHFFETTAEGCATRSNSSPKA